MTSSKCVDLNCKMDDRTLVIIMACIVSVQNAPVDRRVLTCYWPDCREVRVNVTEVREVFVTSCALSRVIVFGDPAMIKIRDLRGRICEATFSPSPPPKHDTTIGQSETSETMPLSSKTTLQSTVQAETTMLTKSGQTETPETTPLISKTTFLSTTSQAETSSSATQPVSTANEAETIPTVTTPTVTTPTVTTPTVTTPTVTVTTPTVTTPTVTTPTITTVGITVKTESGQEILKKLLAKFNKPLEDGETLSDKALGLLAWAVATTFAVAILLLKKWLKKKCENCVREDDDLPTPPPQSIDDDHSSSSSTPPDPDLSTIHPSTPTTIHNDDDDQTTMNDDDGINPPPRTSTPPSPNESRRPLITPLSSVTTSPDVEVEDECVARNTRSKRQLKF